MSSTASALKWYVFYVKARFEKRVVAELTANNFTCYLPLRKILKNYSGQKRWVEQSVFPSYIFVKTKQNQLLDIVQFPGIVWWVRYAGEPATIRQDHLHLIEKLISSQTDFEVKTSLLKVGDEITIGKGPFMGFKAHIQQIRSKTKFVVLLEGLGCSVIVSVSGDDH